MPSPFYIQTPNVYGGMMAARQDAQRDFANQLSQLYAAGDQQAGQKLAGMDPQKLDQIRGALEKLPGSEQEKIAKRTGLLKKWHYAISQEPDESTRALMYSQMLGQIKQAGGDISGLAPSYSKEAIRSQLMDISSVEEMIAMQKEQRLRESAGGSGTEWERTEQELIAGDPNTALWKQKYLKTFMVQQRKYNPVTGRDEDMWLPAAPEISAKALSIGFGLNPPSQQIYDASKGAKPATEAAPTPAVEGPGTTDGGNLTTGAVSVSGTPENLGTKPPVVPASITQGKDPGMSRAERERIDAERRQRERDAKRADKEKEDRKRAEAMKLNEEWRKKQEGYGAYISLINQARALIKNPSTVADLGTINTFQKLIDPGAVVRDADVALLQDTGGLASQLKARIDSAKGTGKLSPQTRSEMLRALDTLESNVKDRERKEKARLGGTADSFGLERRQVFGEGAPAASSWRQR